MSDKLGPLVDIIDDLTRPGPGDLPSPRRVLVDGRALPLPEGASVSILTRIGGEVEVCISFPTRRLRVGYPGELHTRLDDTGERTAEVVIDTSG